MTKRGATWAHGRFEHGLEIVIEGDPVRVNWNPREPGGDPGGMAAVCELCGYVGKTRPHAEAVAAAKQHAGSQRHRIRLRQAAGAR